MTTTGPDHVMEILREALNEYPHPVNFLAVRTGLSVSSIYKIRDGHTKWPRPNTFLLLCSVLGLELTLRKTKNYAKADVRQMTRRHSTGVPLQ